MQFFPDDVFEKRIIDSGLVIAAVLASLLHEPVDDLFIERQRHARLLRRAIR